MPPSSEAAARFRDLHRQGLLRLANAWDAGTARLIEQRGAAQIDNGVFDRGITGKSPDTEPAAVSSGEARTSQRMRPAHTRFTMYEYGNITRSEISAVHEMIREHTEKTKKVCRTRTRTTAHAPPHTTELKWQACVWGCRILTSRRAWSCFENGGRRRRGGRRAP